MRVLVTGGAGFIGSAVCHALVKRGAFVVNVDKLTYAANPRSLDALAHDPHYAFECRDICNRAAMDAVLSKYQPTAVLHLAAESHVDRSISGASPFINTNIAGTYHLLEAARHYWGGLASAPRGLPLRRCIHRRGLRVARRRRTLS
jgi:dTDP-glucose 4,6-dehydratase